MQSQGTGAECWACHPVPLLWPFCCSRFDGENGVAYCLLMRCMHLDLASKRCGSWPASYYPGFVNPASSSHRRRSIDLCLPSISLDTEATNVGRRSGAN